MGRKLDDLAAEAPQLSKDARAALAKRLLESLDDATVDEVGESWIREAERRHAELKATARTSSSEEVFAKLQNRNTR